MIKENEEGRWECEYCGYEWSAVMGDDEVPEICECETEQCPFCDTYYSVHVGHSCYEMRCG
jgi:hypothetical protein